MDVHPPKIELFDVPGRINIDPKGVPRDVEEYRVEPHGLYMARATPGRAQFRYLESWLLPELGLRISDFWFNAGHERDEDFYLDIVDIERDGDRWITTDLYLDVTVADGRGLTVLDADELLAAHTRDLVSAEVAERALTTTFATVNSLAANGYRINDWLAGLGFPLEWQRHPAPPGPLTG